MDLQQKKTKITRVKLKNIISKKYVADAHDVLHIHKLAALYFFSNSNHLLIPNAHTTNIFSNTHNMAILGYHQDKITYKIVQSVINMSKI